jgi:hypothetical protein
MHSQRAARSFVRGLEIRLKTIAVYQRRQLSGAGEGGGGGGGARKQNLLIWLDISGKFRRHTLANSF